MGGESNQKPGSIADYVARTTGVNVQTCYQCGKCSAGCPMAREIGFRPHDVLRLLQENSEQSERRLLTSRSIWLCLTCETCSSRCPNGCDPAQVIDALRERAEKTGMSDPPHRIGAFHRSFLNQIRRSGRIFEFGLVAGYKMRTGALFADVAAVPAMLSRGKLKMAPQKIQGISEIRRIFEVCKNKSESLESSND